MCPHDDDAGQRCVLGRDHDGEHVDGGLRAWLDTTLATAVIRIYEGPDADDQQQREQLLFERQGWRSIAGDDTTRVVTLGPSPDAAAIMGGLAGLGFQSVRARRVAVCYARPPLIVV